jgi:ABC-type siderophore export system fused ATPase/permease subunit
MITPREGAKGARAKWGSRVNYLRTAAFGGLFTVTFTVAAAFQLAMSALGILLVVLSPGLFQMNGVPATSPVQALGTLLFLLAMGLVMNAGISAVGALIWLLVRKLVPDRSESGGAQTSAAGG